MPAVCPPGETAGFSDAALVREGGWLAIGVKTGQRIGAELQIGGSIEHSFLAFAAAHPSPVAKVFLDKRISRFSQRGNSRAAGPRRVKAQIKGPPVSQGFCALSCPLA